MPGMPDGASPENYTPAQLSRVKDVLDAIDNLPVDLFTDDLESARAKQKQDAARLKQNIWAGLSYQLRIEYNYCKWDYVPHDSG